MGHLFTSIPPWIQTRLLHFLAVVNNGTVNMDVHLSLMDTLVYSRSGMAAHMVVQVVVLFLRFIFSFFVHVLVSATCVWAPEVFKRGVGSPGAGVKDGLEQSDMGCGDCSQALWKEQTLLLTTGHLFSPYVHQTVLTLRDSSVCLQRLHLFS